MDGQMTAITVDVRNGALEGTVRRHDVLGVNEAGFVAAVAVDGEHTLILRFWNH